MVGTVPPEAWTLAEKRPAADPPVLVWSPTAARGDVRKWRLHACGCARLKYPPRAAKKWLAYIELAERFADGDVPVEEFDEGRTRCRESRKRGLSAVGGDFDLALYDSDSLARTWQDIVIEGRREYTPGEDDYELVAERFRVLEDLVGPDPLPAFDPAWRSDTAASIARGMYADREFSAMPILADALQDAGCEDAEILGHCRTPGLSHFRGCWAIDLVLGRGVPAGDTAAATGPVKPRRRRRT